MPMVNPARQRDCPACGASKSTLLLEHTPWRLVSCARCQLAYLPEIPTDEQFDTTYEWSESFARERFERWARNPLARLWTAAGAVLRPSRESRAVRRLRAVAPPPGRLLDVGCGDGRLLLAAQRAGYDVLGVELSPKMAAKARWRIGAERIRCARLEETDLAAESFDVAVTVSYLEHEPAPAGVLRRIFDLLRTGGVCTHKVPNYDSRLRRILGSRWSGYRWPEHAQYYTPQTLACMLSQAGFTVDPIHANPWSDNFWITARRP